MRLIESGRIVSRCSLLHTNTKKNVSRKSSLYQLTGYKKILFYKINHRHTGQGRKGGGERGAAAPPNFVQLRCFWAARKNLGRASFLRRFNEFFNYYFEEINIFYFNLKSAQ